MFRNQLETALGNLTDEIKKTNLEQFKNYAKGFENNHKKWQAEQTKLQNAIRMNLKNLKNFSLIGALFFPIALLFIAITSSFEVFWQWTRTFDNVSLIAGGIGILFIFILCSIGLGSLINKLSEHRY